MDKHTKITDSQKLKNVHLMVKGMRMPPKPRGVSSKRGIAFWAVCIGIIIAVALVLVIFL